MKHMQLLLALDEHKSLHRASASMCMTQSAASKALAELESIVGARLFERTTLGLVKNEFGKVVLRHASHMCADLESLCRDVNRIHDGEYGRLVIGTVMGAIPGLVAPAVAKLQEAFPALSLDIIEDTSAQLLALLDNGQVDIVVGRASVSEQPFKYDFRPLLDEPASVVAGPAHRATALHYRDMKSLSGFRWVTYPAHMPMSAMLEHEFRLAGMSMPSNVIATPSAFVALSLLQTSKALVSLLPDSIVKPWAERGELTVFPIPLLSLTQVLGIVVRRDSMPSRFATHFIELIESEARHSSSSRAFAS